MQEAQTVEGETTEADSQPVEQTTEVPEPQQTATEEATERMVPLSVVQKERKLRQETQRKLAELTGNQKLSQYDPTDTEAVMQHPLVQELLIKQAKTELTDHARELLSEFKNIPEVVKKAILKNARGFVNEATTDIETAKLDLQDYIAEIAQELEAESTKTPPVAPKNINVASTNVSKTEVPGVKPAQIQKILNKPIDEWTDEEASVVDKYANQ